MQTEHRQVPDFPKINATIAGGTEGVVNVNGVPHSVFGEDVAATRTAVVGAIAATARKLGRPVRATTVDELGEWPLIVHPDGLVENDTAVESPKKKKRSGSGRSTSEPKPEKERRSRQGLWPKLPRKKPTGQAPSSEGTPPEQKGQNLGKGAHPPGGAASPAVRESPTGPGVLTPTVTETPESGGTAPSAAPEVGEGDQSRIRQDGRGQERIAPMPQDVEALAYQTARHVPGVRTETGGRAGRNGSGGRQAEEDTTHSALDHTVEPVDRPIGALQEAEAVSAAVPAPSTLPAPPAPPGEAGPRTRPASNPALEASPLSRDQARNAWIGAINEHNSVRTGGGQAARGTTDRGPAASASVASSLLRRLFGVQDSQQGTALPAAPPHGARIQLSGHRRVTVLSLKGGVGKTTVAVLLGSVLAAENEQRVIAVDANPHGGTLRDRVPLQHGATVEDLAREGAAVDQYTRLKQYVSVNTERMHALVGSGLPPSGALPTEKAYTAVSPLLTQYYDMVVNDCGTGIEQSGTRNVLDRTDQILLVLEPTLDSSRSARATLGWLSANGFSALAEKAIAVISRVDHNVDPHSEFRDFEAHLASTTKGVIRIPYDHHLAEGGVIRLDRLNERTRTAGRYLATVSTLALEGVPTPSE